MLCNIMESVNKVLKIKTTASIILHNIANIAFAYLINQIALNIYKYIA